MCLPSNMVGNNNLYYILTIYHIEQNGSEGKLWQIAINYFYLLQFKHSILNLKAQSLH